MKKVKLVWLTVSIAFCTVMSFSRAQAQMLSENAACELLKAAALKRHFTNETTPPGKYVCYVDHGMSTKDDFVFGLHYFFTPPPGWVGSNLVGWYAVDRRDGQIFEWDIAELKLGKRLPN